MEISFWLATLNMFLHIITWFMIIKCNGFNKSLIKEIIFKQNNLEKSLSKKKEE